MKKRIFCLLALCALLLQPLAVYAEPLETETKVSLTIHYEHEDKKFANQKVAIYRVAEAFPDGTYELVEPFSSYPVSIHDITDPEQWKQAALALRSYLTADQLQPHWEGTTDEEGVVRFAGLDTGMYLVCEVVAEVAAGYYVFRDFLIYMPSPQPNGTYDYHAVAKPKCVGQTPIFQYMVTKLWQDEGYQATRPKEITVDIYKDGALETTQILSSENNWTYFWKVVGEDPGNWTVVERNVPKQYKVRIQQHGGNITLINTRKSQPDIPKTGDSFLLLPWVMAMCVSGIMLLLLGIYRRRQR